MALRASWLGTILILPIIAFAWSGKRTQRDAEPIIPVEPYSASAEKALLAYAEPLRAVRRLALCKPATGYNGASIQYTSETFAVARQWVAAFLSGQLEEVPPADYIDASNIGVKDHVLNAKRLMGDALLRLSLDWTARKKPETAAEAAVLALEVGQINKYADFPSLMATFGSQYRAVKQLNQLAGQLTPKTKQDLSKRLKSLKFKPIPGILERAEILYAQYTANAPSPISHEDISLIKTAKSIVSKPRPSALAVEDIRDLVRKASGDVPILICAARIGWERETLIKDQISQIQAEISASKTN